MHVQLVYNFNLVFLSLWKIRITISACLICLPSNQRNLNRKVAAAFQLSKGSWIFKTQRYSQKIEKKLICTAVKSYFVKIYFRKNILYFRKDNKDCKDSKESKDSKDSQDSKDSKDMPGKPK